MTTQHLIDWAIAQHLPRAGDEKLMLISLAYSAGPEGGGQATLERLVLFTSTEEAVCRRSLERLSKRGLVVYRIENDIVTFGLSIAERPS
jgi:hypothetical protein